MGKIKRRVGGRLQADSNQPSQGQIPEVEVGKDRVQGAVARGQEKRRKAEDGGQ